MGESAESPDRQPRADHKDIWDKIGALTVPFVTMVIGLLGAYATYTYNQASLNQQAYQTNADRLQRTADATADRLQREQQARDSRRLAEAQQLQGLFAYVSSSDPQRREFGYTMFAAMGNADLAIRLISLKQDRAGIRVLGRLSRDPSSSVRVAAAEGLSTLLTAPQARAVNAIVLRSNTIPRYGVLGAPSQGMMAGDVLYGINGWSIRGGDLGRLLARYCRDHAARVRQLCDGGPLQRPIAAPQLDLLRSAANDPAMRRAQDAEVRETLSGLAGPADAVARDLGLRLPLSIALIRDTVACCGAGRARSLARELGIRAPAQGGDERAWARAYLASQRRLPGGQSRAAMFQRLIEAGDWELRSVDQAAPPAT